MKPIRCAIYTRKSHDDRADVQMSSIDRQHELCAAYIASQGGSDWQLCRDRFDDLGWSGGTIERPSLQRLLQRADDREIDVVVVYKIDRLSRSLLDFVNLVARLDKAGVTFVSVTQAFSTTTSMGRLTLNVLLSFAQFERELIGERSRDWKAGARARGLWTSGAPPFGYRVNNLRLEIHPERAKIVRFAYRRFIKEASFAPVAQALNDAGHRNRFGRPFDGRAIRAMVESRTYRGEMPHKGQYSPGIHPPLVTERVWRDAQAVLANFRGGPRVHPLATPAADHVRKVPS